MNYIGMTVMERMFCILMNIRIINIFKGEQLCVNSFLGMEIHNFFIYFLKFFKVDQILTPFINIIRKSNYLVTFDGKLQIAWAKGPCASIYFILSVRNPSRK